MALVNFRPILTTDCQYVADRIIAETAGIGWEAALAQAEAFLANLTLEEKAGLVTGELG